MVAQEGTLYGGKTWRPSALVLYIMEHVNLGLPEYYQVQWHNIVGKTPWLTTRDHLSEDKLHRYYQELGLDNPSELEQALEDVYHWAVEDAAQREVDNQHNPPSHADEAQTRNSPGPQLPQYENVLGAEPPQPLPEQEDWPHKFVAGPNWTIVTKSKTTSGVEGAQPSVTTSGLDLLDKELGKDNVKDVLGDYLISETETETAVRNLVRANLGLTGSDSMEAMDVDPESLLEPTPEMQDQPMETEQLEPSLGTFQPELGTPRYTPSLIGSTDSPPSPIMVADNALLDADPDAPGLSQSKTPGAGRPEGSSPKPKMTLQKQKQL